LVPNEWFSGSPYKIDLNLSLYPLMQ
jgi:hypothetical protein